MPRPRHSQGRPNAVVIPADWAATHAAVIDRTLDCSVSIGPAGVTPTWNEDRGQTETQPSVAYAGAASITPIADNAEQTIVADDVIPTADYEVMLTAAAGGVAVGHLVTVVTCPSDAMLVGRRLKVTGIEKGSRRFSRILQAVDAD